MVLARAVGVAPPIAGGLHAVVGLIEPHMSPKAVRSLTVAIAVISGLTAASRGVSEDVAGKVFSRIVENWRWSYYWFGKTGIDDVYVSGKKISALFFWSTKPMRPMRGFCSSDISRCVAYEGVYLAPLEREMGISPRASSQQAFGTFVSSGFRDPKYLSLIEGLSLADFESKERLVTLPDLGPPSSISRREIPADAAHEAERIARQLARGASSAEARPDCRCSLVFAYYGPNDPYWFVLRTCSTACEFKGKAIEMLSRGDRGWEATSGGYIDAPASDVERLEHQIERAEMFRLER